MAENNWTINDSWPLGMGQEFAPPPPQWAQAWWGPPLAMYMPAPASAGLPANKNVSENGFFGPKE